MNRYGLTEREEEIVEIPDGPVRCEFLRPHQTSPKARRCAGLLHFNGR